jgi:hypothetical protein
MRGFMSDGSFLGSGQAVNSSDGQVYCWVQGDAGLQIYILDPGMQSTSLVDVDLVKAVPPATLNPWSAGIGTALWFKFSDIRTATVSGSSPNLEINISLMPTSMAPQMTDDEALSAGGLSGPIDQYIMASPGWGVPIPAPADSNQSS